MKKGLFIVFEGGEGSGKSTILEKIYNWLLEENKIGRASCRERVCLYV